MTIRLSSESTAPTIRMELKTARLTVLIDPSKKEAFEALCHSQDMTPSQVVRRMIRDYMAEHQAAAPRKRAAAPAPARKRAR